jgi:hypothetical protein
MSRSFTLASAFAIAILGSTAGCAASKAQGGAQIVWTAPAQDLTYKSPEEASRAYETVKMLAGNREFRYAGNGSWEILSGGTVVQQLVIGNSADIDWNRSN